MAVATGINYGTIVSLESGKSLGNMVTIERIAKAFNMCPSELLRLAEEAGKKVEK